MLDFTDIKLKKLAIHRVGNKFRNEGIVVSDDIQSIENDSVKDLLLKYFLKPFKDDTFYKFHHETEIGLNEVYTYTKRIFENYDNFHKESVNILKYLYSKSVHPNIKSGELYICFFKDCFIKNKKMDAIGIFKSETKDIFLKISQNENVFEVDYEKGVNINKLDKGCIIFNDLQESNYIVSIVDTAKKGDEAVYWKKDFLDLEIFKDDNTNTKILINICKDFSKNINEDQKNDKTDEIEFLNKSLKYIEQCEKFNVDKFINTVLDDNEDKENLKKYVDNYRYNDIKPDYNFTISKTTYNKEKRKIKKYIRLDSSIEIKIASNEIDKNRIEKGFDKNRGMNYYKIYYNNES
ncbi:nucleoid-associated protein [Clostridiaceae bacterium M8S5]|nr:nucleoid-associated protein [Clostridiaceae bacterium M8S5]